MVFVSGFSQETIVDVPLACTYDLEVLHAKYFNAVRAGNVPLEFLFSGTLFYQGGLGLQAAQISWDKEARFSMPAALWQEMMDHYFPNSAWLRLQKDVFDMLYDYKAMHQLPSWEAAVQRLLAQSRPQTTVGGRVP